MSFVAIRISTSLPYNPIRFTWCTHFVPSELGQGLGRVSCGRSEMSRHGTTRNYYIACHYQTADGQRAALCAYAKSAALIVC